MEIPGKVSSIIKKKFNIELIYSEKDLKVETKIKIKINIKGGFQCLYTPINLIDSVFRKDENYYPKVLLKTIFCSNSDEEYHEEECMNLFLKTAKK